MCKVSTNKTTKAYQYILCTRILRAVFVLPVAQYADISSCVSLNREKP